MPCLRVSLLTCLLMYHIAWMPGDGIGNDVMDAARVVLDALKLDAQYTHAIIITYLQQISKRLDQIETQMKTQKKF